MLNSLGSSCTADMQSIDCKMNLAFFFPPLTVSVKVHMVDVDMFSSSSIGVVLAFLLLLACTRFSAVQQGRCLRESRRQIYSDVLDRLLLELLTPSKED